MEMYDIEKIPMVISAACVLHNVILMKENLNLDIELQDLKINIEHEVGNELVGARRAHASAVQKKDEIATDMARHM